MRGLVASETAAGGVALRQVLRGLGVRCGADDCVPLPAFRSRATHDKADLILIEIGADPRIATGIIESIAPTIPSTIFAVGGDTAVNQADRLRAAGARGFCHRDRVHKELLDELEEMRLAKVLPFRQGRLIPVFSANPGCGVTTVATGLAFALARQHPGKVLLAEMGPGVPEIALDLDLAPQHSPADLAREWQFVDPTFVRQAVTRHADGVDILAYPAGTPIAAALDPVAMRHLCVLFSNIYEVTVLDMGHTLNSSIPAILPFADPVVVVTRPEVPSLRLGRALLQQLGQLNVPSSRIWPIVNRDRQRRQVSWREAEQALALPVTAWIPDDPGALNHAHNLGQPITNAASRSIVTRSFNDLARVLHARPLA